MSDKMKNMMHVDDEEWEREMGRGGKNEFEKNHPQQLKDFQTKLTQLVDEYHANIYLMDKVFEGINLIEEEIKKHH